MILLGFTTIRACPLCAKDASQEYPATYLSDVLISPTFPAQHSSRHRPHGGSILFARRFRISFPGLSTRCARRLTLDESPRPLPLSPSSLCSPPPFPPLVKGLRVRAFLPLSGLMFCSVLGSLICQFGCVSNSHNLDSTSSMLLKHEIKG